MVSSWQLLIGLFALIVATSLQDLNEDSQRNSKAAWEWTLDNNDDSSAGRLGLPTTTEPSGITQLLPGGGGGGDDVMRSDITISNGSGGGCASLNNGLSRRRIRARDEKSCVEKNFLPFSSSGEEEEDENGRQLLPPAVRPNAQQQGGGGQNSGGGGSGEPKFRVVLPRMNDLLQFQFLPRDNRPKRDSQLCPDPLRPFPICGRPGDSYITSNRIAPGLVVDPAYLCTFVLSLLLCCLMFFYFFFIFHHHHTSSHKERFRFFFLKKKQGRVDNDG